ncbi:energy transducer TonB [Wenyingzhuangia aestuarii]|uniref:energy transducer TonB n=1 Tax=Wenyingzhuangia aestuarii TaxID=1647582 RepID=UPI001438EBA3|nr:energy transducer TonB [Wenyingzhuangia aestuarii]NJB83270.1 outer membrane biosynthesis protein TonB [Wenyingzhuangia aestuarii]
MILKTTYQRKAAIITTAFAGLVLFLLFFCGLRYLDPPEEYGVAINFGTSEVGAGEPKLNESIKSSPVESQPKQAQEELKQSEEVQEKVLTQATEEAPVVKEAKEVKKTVPKVVEKKAEPKKTVKKEVVKEPTPTKETQNALNNLFGKTATGKTAESEGDDNVNGVKGAESGDPNSTKYYGNDGLGGEGNYLLKGRRVLSKFIREPNCNEEGIVVVKVVVDRSGKVISAEPGFKGTTNTSPCLLKHAKKAALATKWNPDGNAPSKQIGLIRYEFIGRDK